MVFLQKASSKLEQKWRSNNFFRVVRQKRASKLWQCLISFLDSFLRFSLAINLSFWNNFHLVSFICLRNLNSSIFLVSFKTFGLFKSCSEICYLIPRGIILSFLHLFMVFKLLWMCSWKFRGHFCRMDTLKKQFWIISLRDNLKSLKIKMKIKTIS